MPLAMDRPTLLFVRANAALFLILGLLLAGSPWLDSVFAGLGLPNPQPPLFTQFAGAMMLPYAVLLWQPDRRHLMVTIGANLLLAIVIASWILAGAVSWLGGFVLLVIGVLLFVFITVQIRFLRYGPGGPPRR
jgi:hypothetical protein